MIQEKTFAIAAIIGIAVIISIISLALLPLNTENDKWWAYNTMRNKLIQTEGSPQIIELEEDVNFQKDIP